MGITDMQHLVRQEVLGENGAPSPDAAFLLAVSPPAPRGHPDRWD